MNDARDLDGKVAIVTGAAGGVGSEVVRLLVERGASVIAEDIDPRVRERELTGDGTSLPSRPTSRAKVRPNGPWRLPSSIR